MTKKVFSLNPLKRVNSILTLITYNKAGEDEEIRLNPLKRVNSILTRSRTLSDYMDLMPESQSPQTGQFNSYANYYALLELVARLVSIPSNGSIQFLRELDLSDKSSLLESQSPQTGQFNSYYQCRWGSYRFV